MTCFTYTSSFLAGKEEQEQCAALAREAELRWAASLQHLGWSCSSSQAPSSRQLQTRPRKLLFHQEISSDPWGSDTDPGGLVPAALEQWKCKAQLHFNSIAETQKGDVLGIGLQNGEPEFKLIWGKVGRPELPGFTVWTKKNLGSSGSFPNKIQATGDPKSPVWGFSVRGARNLGFIEKSSHVILRPLPLDQTMSYSGPQLEALEARGRNTAVTSSPQLVTLRGTSELAVSQYSQGKGVDFDIKLGLKMFLPLKVLPLPGKASCTLEACDPVRLHKLHCTVPLSPGENTKDFEGFWKSQCSCVTDKFTERNCSALGDFPIEWRQMMAAVVVLESREEMTTLTQFLLSFPTITWVTLP